MPPDVWITTNQQGVWIKFHGFSTHGAQPGAFCACGIAKFASLESIDSAELQNAATGEPIPGFSFVANAATSASMDELGENSFQGFLSSVTQTIPDLPDVSLVIHVVLRPGANVAQLQAEIREATAGGQNAGGAGIATPDGPINPSQFGFFQAGTVMCDIPVPALGALGALLLAALLTGLAWVRTRGGTGQPARATA